jgi:hypothetical protein
MIMRQESVADRGGVAPGPGDLNPPGPGDSLPPSPGDITPPHTSGDDNPPPGPQSPGLGVEPPQPPVLAVSGLRTEPETLNLKSNGVFACFIQLSSGYRAEDIDPGSLECLDAGAVRFNVKGNQG